MRLTRCPRRKKYPEVHGAVLERYKSVHEMACSRNSSNAQLKTRDKSGKEREDVCRIWH